MKKNILILFLILFSSLSFAEEPEELETWIFDPPFFFHTKNYNVKGFALSAFASVYYNHAEPQTITGLAIGGLGNYAKEEMNGIQIAGVTNFSGKANGISIAGLGNYADKEMNGIQIASLYNVTDVLHGVQISAFNYASQSVYGVQIGVSNVGGENVSGLQIGIFNGTKKLNGVQIGLVNSADNIKVFYNVPILNFHFDL